MLAVLEPLPGLAFVLGVGTLAQWLAWRFKLPAILLLLVAGFLAGPVTGLFDPEKAFGELFRPIISLAVGLILFEGGLTLRFQEVRGSGSVVRNLVSVGAVVTWLLSTAIGVWVVGIDFDVALLVGALLTLTGPTVVIPLLRHVRPSGPAGAVLRWEGILIDPIGAMLAIVVFEAISGGEHATASAIALEVGRIVVFGSVIGLVAGFALARALELFLVPDMLHVPVTLGTVAVAFVGADMLQPEAGLFAVTIMGITLANRKALDVDHIAEWKEHLSTILLSVLFVSIAAFLPLEPFTEIGWRALIYAALLIVLVRPIAVWASTLGSDLAGRDRAFLMAMAPRGIVVAAVSSELALQMEQDGDPGASAIVALVFPTIVITVLVYGLLSRPFAKLVGVSRGDAQGALIVGADVVGREIGSALKEQGFEVLLVDTNARSTQNARTMGLPTFHGSVLSTRFAENVDLHDIGYLLALLSSDEVNRLAAQEFIGSFGRPNLYRTTPAGQNAADLDASVPGRLLFGATVTTEWLRYQLRAGARIKATKLTEQFGPEEYDAYNTAQVVPLFVVSADRRLRIVTADGKLELQVGDTVLSLVIKPTDEEKPADVASPEGAG